MPHELVSIITTGDPEGRNRSLEDFCRRADAAGLIEAACELDRFRAPARTFMSGFGRFYFWRPFIVIICRPAWGPRPRRSCLTTAMSTCWSGGSRRP